MQFKGEELNKNKKTNVSFCLLLLGFLHILVYTVCCVHAPAQQYFIRESANFRQITLQEVSESSALSTSLTSHLGSQGSSWIEAHSQLAQYLQNAIESARRLQSLITEQLRSAEKRGVGTRGVKSAIRLADSRLQHLRFQFIASPGSSSSSKAKAPIVAC